MDGGSHMLEEALDLTGLELSKVKVKCIARRNKLHLIQLCTIPVGIEVPCKIACHIIHDVNIQKYAVPVPPATTQHRTS